MGAYTELFPPINREGIMAIYKWAVKLNSPRLACRAAAVKVHAADVVSPTINTQPEPSGSIKKNIYLK